LRASTEQERPKINPSAQEPPTRPATRMESTTVKTANLTLAAEKKKTTENGAVLLANGSGDNGMRCDPVSAWYCTPERRAPLLRRLGPGEGGALRLSPVVSLLTSAFYTLHYMGPAWKKSVFSSSLPLRTCKKKESLPLLPVPSPSLPTVVARALPCRRAPRRTRPPLGRRPPTWGW
jgi:hypothetical protein